MLLHLLLSFLPAGLPPACALTPPSGPSLQSGSEELAHDQIRDQSQEQTEAQEPQREQSTPEPLPDCAGFTASMQAHSGFLDCWWDPRGGKVYLQVPPARAEGVCLELIYVEGLASGLGSNPIGLDRGQLGASRLLCLRRLGPKVLIQERNTAFRALSQDAAERTAVEQSFAPSTLFAAEVMAEDADGHCLIDLSGFLLRDTHGVKQTLGRLEQGKASLDLGRSAIEPSALHAFPDNLELDVSLTYSVDGPGRDVRQTVPDAGSLSLRLHHSFVRLPDAGYRPRVGHPDVGFMAIDFLDYAVPLSEPLQQRWIQRHRLQKVDPRADRSPAIEPLVYYVDRGAPPQIREALLDGARWWAQAFEAAGFVDAFRVEVLPPDIHPLDVRYNVIHWVHRSTRGWSYGGSVHDPRTGEILKGNVLLGSLRVRQDRLLFEGLSDATRSGQGGPGDPVELALARIRQLSAHEVGHTLGLVHNFAASTVGRASVMDYPAPWVRVDDEGGLDFSEAYGVGLGAWDVHSIRYGYQEFPAESEAQQLARIVQEGRDPGLIFLTDADARPADAAHPSAHLWDNGADAVQGLQEVYEVRRIALNKFGPRNLAVGQPLAHLQEVLVPVYLHHRYQLEAAAKLLGGVDYRYAVWNGETAQAQAAVPASMQRGALELIVQALQPEFLALRPSLRALLLPRPVGSVRHRELFQGATEPIFDPVSAATAVADHVFEQLLQPARLARMELQSREDPQLPAPKVVLDRLVQEVFVRRVEMPPEQEVLRAAVQDALVARLRRGERDPSAPASVREALYACLRSIELQLSGEVRRARPRLLAEIVAHRERPETSLPTMPAAPLPPGSPIGCGHAEWRH